VAAGDERVFRAIKSLGKGGFTLIFDRWVETSRRWQNGLSFADPPLIVVDGQTVLEIKGQSEIDSGAHESTVAIPEPSSVLFLVLSALGLARFRCR